MSETLPGLPATQTSAPVDSVDPDKTHPPATMLRYGSPEALFLAIPQISEMVQARPREGEEMAAFLSRLRSSTTPEEAVTFTAFAVVPQLAVWWAYECLRLLPEQIEPRDRPLLEAIAGWTAEPTQDRRFALMREALFAPFRSPTVMLALAVGWSGGPLAPNDPMPVPLHRAPRSINAAVLSCLARADLSRRSVLLARFITMAEALYRG
ncbi:hypothetical protein SAMN05877809_105128 [Rhodobacter sp. JA431]|uniref:DUF6931 family protein n=1 Tax=Rhodobacter sp. JA431 TaxID=570013 RepID=UPI000BC710AA|nr:hypothetical protein [Rhodobacter sp. JA431]SOC10467.1 hypothetical protein SAMN05877809_105128 [Rhodobacter sp. JA431]